MSSANHLESLLIIPIRVTFSCKETINFILLVVREALLDFLPTLEVIGGSYLEVKSHPILENASRFEWKDLGNENDILFVAI